MLLLAERPGNAWVVELICQDPCLASGACHRSLQILELLKHGGYQLTAIEEPPRPKSAALALQGLSNGLRDGFYLPLSLASLSNAGVQASRCSSLFSRYPQARGLIIEGTGFGSLTATAWCRRHGKRTILVPANLESLATYPPMWPYGRLTLMQRFQNELKWLKQADAVVTIAIEEAWLLELHGITSHHLPYYPPRAHRQGLEQLASARQQFLSAPDAQPIGYLMVADFGNAPNRIAFERLLDWLKQTCTGGQPVHVAGRRSTDLAACIPPGLEARLVIHGELSEKHLFDLQRRCQALLILHPATSGMLTRIIDAALADLPVVGDWMSFKSYHHFFANGLLRPPNSSTADPAETATPAPAVIQRPLPPEQAASRFLKLLQR